MYGTLCLLIYFDMTHHHRNPGHGNKTTECCNSQDWFDPILTHTTIWVHSQGYWVYTMHVACNYNDSAIISNGNGWIHKHWYILHGWNNLPAYLILKWNVFSYHLLSRFYTPNTQILFMVFRTISQNVNHPESTAPNPKTQYFCFVSTVILNHTHHSGFEWEHYETKHSQYS